MNVKVQFRSTTLLMALFGLMFFACGFLWLTSGAHPTGARPAPVRTPKCTVDIAGGEEFDCTLVKSKDEWILWSNSAASPRSIHFKATDNPFTEASCWVVEPGARARSGPVALNAALKTYISYTSDVSCNANPPSDAGHSAKVTVE